MPQISIKKILIVLVIIITLSHLDKIIAAFDNENYYYEQTLHSTFITNPEYSTLFILGLFNSNLFKFYYQAIVKQSGTIFPQVRISMLKSLPIKKTNEKEQAEIAKLAQLMLDLQKELQQATVNTDKYDRLKTEIERLDDKIDQAIYKLYNLTDEEITTIEK